MAISYGLDEWVSEFESLKRQEFAIIYVVQISSGIHSALYLLGKAAEA
jgi:hypothetical protein